MFDILNNRELAILIWVSIALGFLLIKKDFRKSVRGLLKTAFASKLTIMYSCMILYTCLMVYIIYEIGLWNNGQIKNTIFWLLFAGLPTLINASKAHEDKSYFKKALKDIFKFTAITEFIVNLYSFSLILELIIVPVIFLIVITSVVAKSDKKNAPVAKILDFLLSCFGFCLIVFAVFKLVENFTTFTTLATLSDFLVPSLLTVLFLPFVFFFSLYMKYEDVFIMLRFKISNPALQRFAKYQALINFNFRVKDLERWQDLLYRRERNTKKAIVDSIKELKKMKALEKNPPSVPENLGWSPYQAKDFLLSEAVETGYYQLSYEEEWAATSKYVKINDEIFASNIAYYVYGDIYKATSLEIHVNVNSIKHKNDAHKKLLECAQVLYLKAVKKEMSGTIKTAILLGINNDFTEGNKNISISKQEWLKHKDKGYSLKFRIQIKQQT